MVENSSEKYLIELHRQTKPTHEINLRSLEGWLRLLAVKSHSFGYLIYAEKGQMIVAVNVSSSSSISNSISSSAAVGSSYKLCFILQIPPYF